TPIVTYLLRCNSDVTSLLVCTILQTMLSTKQSLKTYQLFSSAYDVFESNLESNLNFFNGSIKLLGNLF
ncbi:hypothetical protein L208DRAFT_1246017, partial [Tricholoma matsutake]